MRTKKDMTTTRLENCHVFLRSRGGLHFIGLCSEVVGPVPHLLHLLADLRVLDGAEVLDISVLDNLGSLAKSIPSGIVQVEVLAEGCAGWLPGSRRRGGWGWGRCRRRSGGGRWSGCWSDRNSGGRSRRCRWRGRHRRCGRRGRRGARRVRRSLELTTNSAAKLRPKRPASSAIPSSFSPQPAN